VKKLVYPKTYATIVKMVVFAHKITRAGSKVHKRFSPEEWSVVRWYEHSRRHYHDKTMVTLLLESGEELVLDLYSEMVHTGGHRTRSTKKRRWGVGCRLKLFRKPDGRKRWYYKLTGE
jgi:hypothetical protein